MVGNRFNAIYNKVSWETNGNVANKTLAKPNSLDDLIGYSDTSSIMMKC